MKKVAFETLGCKVNQYETQAMREIMEKNDFTCVESEEDADICIINSCTVTNVADRKSRQHIGQAKKKNPNIKIIICGCLAQRDGESLLKIEGVDAVIGSSGKKNIAEVANRLLGGETKFSTVKEILHDHCFEDISITKNDERLRANLKICDGCRNFCSYCIIPYTRGPVRSKELEKITEEAKKLAENGLKEIVLTGIQVASYGIDLEGKPTLLDAIKAVRVPGIERIRLSSIEPKILTEEFCKEASQIKELCRHFHVSLQSGSSSVLKRMNRRYDAEEYAGYIGNLRKYFDNPGITTDIIAGFPGETEAEHKETLEFVKRIKFSKIHVFPYSKREGTVAAKMPSQVLNEEKKRRANEISELEKQFAEEFLDSFIGKEDGVLIETEEGIGHTDRYAKVKTEGLPNEMVKVKIISRDGDTLIAKRISNI